MFCTNCGNKVADGSAFCNNCGAKLIQPGTPAPAPAKAPAPTEPTPAPAAPTPAPAPTAPTPAAPAPTPTPSPAAPTPAPASPAPGAEKKPPVKLIIIIAAAVVALVLIIVLIVTLTGDKKSSSKKSGKSSSSWDDGDWGDDGDDTDDWGSDDWGDDWGDDSSAPASDDNPGDKGDSNKRGSDAPAATKAEAFPVYKAFLESKGLTETDEYGDAIGYNFYALYDMDGDGLEEMIIRMGPVSTEGEVVICTYKDGNLSYYDGIEGMHVGIFGCSKGGLYLVYSSPLPDGMAQRIDKYTLSGTTVDKEVIYDWTEFTGDDTVTTPDDIEDISTSSTIDLSPLG